MARLKLGSVGLQQGRWWGGGDVSVCPHQLPKGSACVTAGCASVVMRVHGMCEAAAHLLEAFGCCSPGLLYVTVIC